MRFLKTNSFIENKILTFHLDILFCVEIKFSKKNTVSNGIHLH